MNTSKNIDQTLKETSQMVVRSLLHFKPHENVLIYADLVGECTAKSLQKSAEEIGAQTHLHIIPKDTSMEESVKVLIEDIETNKYQLICELATEYFYQTPVWQTCLQQGGRLYAFGGITPEAFIRCYRKVNHDDMFRFGMALMDILKEGKNIRITSGQGTDINMRMNNNRISQFICKLLRKETSYIVPPSGILNRDIHKTFMGGGNWRFKVFLPL